MSLRLIQRLKNMPVVACHTLDPLAAFMGGVFADENLITEMVIIIPKENLSSTHLGVDPMER